MARTTTRKGAATKATAEKAVAPATSVNTTAEKQIAATSAAKKAAAKKTTSATTTTAATKKTTAKKTTAARKTTAAKRTTAGRPASSPRAARPSTESAARKLSVKSGEDPWTTAELAEVRGELDADRTRLRSELNLAEHELHDLMVDANEGAGNDQADVGSATFERDHEIRIAKNARDMLEQTERALARIDDGSYGICESGGEPIGKLRVMAFPRATLCLSCKQREERR